ncbi:MAG: ABC transporter permease subunit [Anaerolineales bacterium]|nr:ABC transporter permease subunit [Anaerolineales bacterium]
MWSFFLHELRSKRGALLGWSLGMCGFVLLYVGLYPSFAEQVPGFKDLLDLPIYQALGVSTMSTFPGWLSSTVLNFMPIIVGVYALIAGTGTLAGEEERGTLENIVALPLSRWQIVTSKFLAILVTLTGILVLTALVTLSVTAWVKTQIDVNLVYGAIWWAIIAALPLLGSLAAAALLLGAFLPTRGAASGVSIFMLIASYLSNNLFGQIENLRNYRFLSPFYYFNSSATAFTEGVAWGDVAALLALTLVLFALALLSFQRRDLMTHRWFWDRPRPVQ